MKRILIVIVLVCAYSIAFGDLVTDTLRRDVIRAGALFSNFSSANNTKLFVKLDKSTFKAYSSSVKNRFLAKLNESTFSAYTSGRGTVDISGKVDKSHFSNYSANRAAAPAGSAAWGGISGTLSTQSDLQGALDSKAPVTSGTALLKGNGAGGFSSYTGSACTGENHVVGIGSSGAVTCDNTGGYETIMDEGSELDQWQKLNFTGAGITCTNDVVNERTNCSVPDIASGAVSTHSALTTGVHGAGSNNFVYSNDSRLTDSRAPTAHNQAETTVTFTDVTTGNVSTSSHGFAPKGTAGTTQFWRQDWTLATPAGGGGGVGTMTRLTSTWASSASANATGIIGTGSVPMTSPTYGAGAPFSFRCIISTTRPATTNGPRYGAAASSGSVTRISATHRIGLAATTRTETKVIVAMTTNCAAGCSSAMTTGTLAQVVDDEIDGTGVMNASGAISLYMAPSAAAANTAQIGSYCIWY